MKYSKNPAVYLVIWSKLEMKKKESIFSFTSKPSHGSCCQAGRAGSDSCDYNCGGNTRREMGGSCKGSAALMLPSFSSPPAQVMGQPRALHSHYSHYYQIKACSLTSIKVILRNFPSSVFSPCCAVTGLNTEPQPPALTGHKENGATSLSMEQSGQKATVAIVLRSPPPQSSAVLSASLPRASPGPLYLQALQGLPTLLYLLLAYN